MFTFTCLLFTSLLLKSATKTIIILYRSQKERKKLTSNIQKDLNELNQLLGGVPVELDAEKVKDRQDRLTSLTVRHGQLVEGYGRRISDWETVNEAKVSFL